MDNDTYYWVLRHSLSVQLPETPVAPVNWPSIFTNSQLWWKTFCHNIPSANKQNKKQKKQKKQQKNPKKNPLKSKTS